MSVSLSLYVTHKKHLIDEEIIPKFILDLNETYLAEYFIEGEGKEFVKKLPNKDTSMYVLTCDEEMPQMVNKTPYDESLTYCESEQFGYIPKELIKKERAANQAVIKMIKKLKNYIVILYWE